MTGIETARQALGSREAHHVLTEVLADSMQQILGEFPNDEPAARFIRDWHPMTAHRTKYMGLPAAPEDWTALMNSMEPHARGHVCALFSEAIFYHRADTLGKIRQLFRDVENLTRGQAFLIVATQDSPTQRS